MPPTQFPKHSDQDRLTAPYSSIVELFTSGKLSSLAEIAKKLPTSTQANAATLPGSTTFNLDAGPLPQNEESVAVFGNQVVGGANDYRGILGSPWGYSGFYVSTDGGQSVLKDGTLLPVTLTEGVVAESVKSGGDPALDVDSSGNFYYASLYYSFDRTALVLAKSINTNLFGSSACSTSNPCWTLVVVYQGVGTGPSSGLTFEDKEWLAVDRSTSAYAGYVYVTWTHFTSTGSSVLLARCSPSLSCFIVNDPSNPLSGTDASVQFSMPVVDASGNVYVVWRDYSVFPSRLKMRVSGPGGASFGPPIVVRTLASSGRWIAYDDFRWLRAPKIAVDVSNPYSTFGHPGRLYFVWDDYGSLGLQVLLMYTDNQGAAWQGPFLVSGDITTLGSSAFFPWVSVDPQGVVNISYYSTQFDPPWSHRYDVMLAQSLDGGVTFTNTRVTPYSNEPDDDPLLGGYFIGDYFQSVSVNGAVYIHYNGNYALKAGYYQQDNYLAKVQYLTGANVYAVVRGTDNRIYYGSNVVGSWGGWSTLPGSTADSVGAAVCGGKLHVAVRGTDNKIYYSSLTFANGAFSGWTALGGTTPSAPALAAASDCTLYLVVRGTDDHIYLNIMAGIAWSGFAGLPGTTVRGPAAVVAGSVLHLAVYGTDSNLYHGRMDRTTLTFLGWSPLATTVSPLSVPALAAASPTEVYVAYRGTDSHIYVNIWNGAAWTAWSFQPNANPAGESSDAPSITVAGGSLYVGVRDPSSGIWFSSRDRTTGAFSGWIRILGSTPSTPKLVAA